MFNKLKIFKLTPIIILTLCLFSKQVISQFAKIDTNKIEIGQQTNILLKIEIINNNKCVWPIFADTLQKGIEIIKVGKIDTSNVENSNNILLQQQITITSFDSGNYVIAPFYFTIINKNDTSVIYTQPLDFKVSNCKIDLTKDIKDIKNIIKAPYTFSDIAPWLLLLLLITLLVFGFIYYRKRRLLKKPIIQLVAKPHKTPFEIASDKLENIKKNKLWQKYSIKEYYTELTDIVREYLDAQFNLNTAEMTSYEIMKITKAKFGEIQNLNSLLQISDFVKFAKAKPANAEHELHITNAIDIVKFFNSIAINSSENNAEKSNQNNEVDNITSSVTNITKE